jgi:hypothetical protein
MTVECTGTPPWGIARGKLDDCTPCHRLTGPALDDAFVKAPIAAEFEGGYQLAGQQPVDCSWGAVKVLGDGRDGHNLVLLIRDN